jgi:YrhK-like protein
MHRITWWTAALFAIGASCFAVGSSPPYFLNVPGTVVAVTFFIGSILFTCAGFLQYVLAVNTGRDSGTPAPVRWFGWRQLDGEWWAAVIQSFGTVMFNISTFAAISTTLSTTQVDRLVWAPDALGSIAFLVSSYVAFGLVCRAPWRWLPRRQSWRIAALNLVGSVAFGVSAVGAFVIPATGDLIDERWTNAGTFAGAACFLLGAALLFPRRPSGVAASRRARRPPAVERSD